LWFGFFVASCGKRSKRCKQFLRTRNEPYYLQPCPNEYDFARCALSQFDIKQDDTLEHPQHIDKQFEAIVANPPFSAQWSANPLFTSDDRFSQYGKLAPSSKADFAFVQHMIYHLAENGTMAIVLPHGALFRGGAEQHIRRYLIENKNYLDAVIGLPANIFYGTPIPTCIMVFKKCRENPDDVLFIDAANTLKRNTKHFATRRH
jgi:type I restriction enzyme M protein